jgi:probable HAF family extracellular repeat protein
VLGVVFLVVLGAGCARRVAPGAPHAPSSPVISLPSVASDYAELTAMDGTGVFVGRSLTSLGEWRGFVWAGEKVQWIGTLGGTEVHPRAVSARGVVVGVSTTQEGAGQAFSWRDGSGIRSLVERPHHFSDAIAVFNDGRAVVHVQQELEGPMATYVESGSGLVVVDGMTVVAGLSPMGELLGTSLGPDGTRRPAIWSDGTVRTLPSLSEAYPRGEIVAGNRAGVFVGSSRSADNVLVPVAWRDGSVRKLPADGASFGAAVAVSEQGVVLGRLFYDDSESASGIRVESGVWHRDDDRWEAVDTPDGTLVFWGEQLWWLGSERSGSEYRPTARLVLDLEG